MNAPGRSVFVNGIPVVNNLSHAQNYSVNLDKYEALTQSLYDSAAYPLTGAAQITYFQLPIGSGVGVISGAAKTPEDTNMQAAGSMPAMQAYIITSIELDLQPNQGAAPTVAQLPAAFGAGSIAQGVNEAWVVRTSGYVNLNIGSKAYMTEGPLMKFPASNDFEIDAALSDATSQAINLQSRIAYGKAVGPSYVLAPNNLLLIPNQNFALTLNWATVKGTQNPMRIFARFMGQLLRAAQ